MPYVDGFVLAVPKRNKSAYKKMSLKAGKIWRKYGALEYRECWGDDLDIQGMLSFNKLAKVKPGETVVFAYIVYKSRADRDRINKKVMKDPELMADCNAKKMPFDMKRMAYGGFSVFVDA